MRECVRVCVDITGTVILGYGSGTTLLRVLRLLLNDLLSSFFICWSVRRNYFRQFGLGLRRRGVCAIFMPCWCCCWPSPPQVVLLLGAILLRDLGP